jgi:hypothetical protein
VRNIMTDEFAAKPDGYTQALASYPRYEALAIELATDPPRLAKIKQQLAGRRLTTPLFDTLRCISSVDTLSRCPPRSHSCQREIPFHSRYDRQCDH